MLILIIIINFFQGLFACSCVDCEASCPTNMQPPLIADDCMIAGVNCTSFTVALTMFLVLSAAVVGFSIGMCLPIIQMDYVFWVVLFWTLLAKPGETHRHWQIIWKEKHRCVWVI